MRVPAVLSIGLRLALSVAVASGSVGCASLTRSDKCNYPFLQRELNHAEVHWRFAKLREAWSAALDTHPPSAEWSQYNECLEDLIAAALASGRLDPSRGLLIRDGAQRITIPVVHHDFPWSPSDFQQLYPSSGSRGSQLERYYACDGIGATLVAVRCRNEQCPIESRFYPKISAISTTALLRFDENESPVLEFYNPLTRPSLRLGEIHIPIARDTSASLAWGLENIPRTYMKGFTNPGDPETESRLTFLEPYQQGKIPVVFAHGLLSDPQSMADMVNDLRNAPGFTDSHQVWYYRYPTGQGILQSAAILREELNAAVNELDPACLDPALRRIVLIGHSMGGLISKLQVTASEDRIWRQVAKQPLENIVTDEKTRAELARLTFFDPSPHIASVIFIATPHKGGLPYSALIGKGASELVDMPDAQETMHAQLLADNPGVFRPWVERGFPTSVDMLAPESPLLTVMQQMPRDQRVTLHNIIGISNWPSIAGASDGVVSVSSAEHLGCESTVFVGECHTQVHRSREASQEVLRILLVPRPEAEGVPEIQTRVNHEM